MEDDLRILENQRRIINLKTNNLKNITAQLLQATLPTQQPIYLFLNKKEINLNWL
jgi:hypothetical protein